MELKGNKQEMVTRLAVCVVVALILYYGGEKLCTLAKIPLWEQYRPWLEQNRIQAIAIAAAVLFGISLAVLPLSGQEDAVQAPAPEPEPCGAYEEAGGGRCRPAPPQFLAPGKTKNI